ncbi:hypothetical protein [Hymenobacter chitinivorans]|uniref:MG2 domain-containing protein n=1 Tax=Hymenobacter chitinivorans DSM 11115 TaxID=1121954 RepID=A0A2M9B4X0_9BACT|nr:hypothetical protein [Hymenobacter chitinivorans]PJJ52987.1 hypothetical protein CLV45_3645 [Hymenobacter chitinivorans DSM 11115]
MLLSSPFLLRFGPRLLGRLLPVALGLLGAAPAFGQADSLAQLSRRLRHYSQQRPAEKLFAHLDRPSYVSGETMWFKLYTVDGQRQQPLAASTVAYVEVLNAEQRPVLQAKLGLRHATGQGSLVLPASLPSGTYTVRAYTSWMRNFGPELYFHCPVTIVNTRVPVGPPADKPAAGYDPQFFPEGGYLVQGLASKVGFKITDARGRGVAAEGSVLDAAGQPVATFKTLKFGLGSFAFTPAAAGSGYKAVIRLANQQTITCPLPAVREQGYVLRLEDADAGQLRVTVRTQGAALAGENLYLLAHTRQQVAVAAASALVQGQAVFGVEKSKLTAGITHFTLFNSRREPVCERLYFRPPSAGLGLTVRPDNSQYAARQKVTLQLAAGASAAPANLSVAVYQLDSLTALGGPDISSYLWLSSEVKGPIENPAYYCTAPEADAQAAAATDNLMLTQGWSRFRWAEVLSGPPAPAYLPELNGHLVRGRVVHRLTGAPTAGVGIYLAAPSRAIQLYNSVSKADGSVQFETADWYGPRQLVLQPNATTADSLYRVDLLNPFSEQYAPAARPAGLVLTEALAGSLRRRHVQAQVQQQFFGSRPARYLAPPTDSLAFYGRPDERYLLDAYTRFKVMEEVMREYVPGVLVRIRKDGFHFLVPDDNAREYQENPLVLLDGMPVFDTNKIMAFDPLKVQKLEVVTKRYFVGPFVHPGIVSYTTYKGDLAGFPLDAHALLQEYEGLQGQRDFYAPRYDTPAQQQSRLPDFRNLLYWNPEVVTTPGALPELSFYTSDQVGRYRVVVQGLSQNGLSGSTTATFEVKPAL